MNRRALCYNKWRQEANIDIRLEEAFNSRLREVDEPIKQKGAGRPNTKVSRVIERKELKAYLSNKRILSRHKRSEAEFVDETELKKIGLPRKDQSGPTARQARPKVFMKPSQVSQVEAVEEVVLVESQNNTVVIDQMSNSQQTQPTETVTIKEKYVTLQCPWDFHGRPARSTYTIIEEYLSQLPPLIVPFVLSTDEVDGDGNCGFHVDMEQIGHFDEAVIEDVTQSQYLRNKMPVQLLKYKDLYMKMMSRGYRYDKEQDFKDLFVRVKCLKVLKTIKGKYWMTIPKCGYLLVEALNCVVHLFVPARYGHCFTFAPSRTVFNEPFKDRRIVMTFLNEMHFIGLRVKRDCPLPPLGGWTDYFPTNHYKDWLKQYEPNMVKWVRVMNDNYPDELLELLSSDDNGV